MLSHQPGWAALCSLNEQRPFVSTAVEQTTFCHDRQLPGAEDRRHDGDSDRLCSPVSHAGCSHVGVSRWRAGRGEERGAGGREVEGCLSAQDKSPGRGFVTICNSQGSDTLPFLPCPALLVQNALVNESLELRWSEVP